MTDIVERLRKVKAEAWIDGGPPEFYPDPLSQEAADEIERLQEAAGHYQCEYNLAAKDLAEAEALLRALDYDRPIVECQDFHHRKEDLNHPFTECGPANRWEATWEKIDSWLSLRQREGNKPDAR